jgi:chloramphenicol-sensitive protein RarD
MNIGILYALVTYILWGLFPIYWKQLQHTDAAQLIAHRIFWAFIMLLLIVWVTGQRKKFRATINAKTLRSHGLAALLLGVNWLTYVWAVNNGYIVESSLGYFINPLFSVFLGMVFLKERLRPLQWVPIVLATIGVLYLTYIYGRLPWIALMLAFTFGIYGLLKKQSSLGSLYGLTLETGIILLPALAYLTYIGLQGNAAFMKIDLRTDIFLIGAGLVTAVPLLTFAKAAQRIPLTMIGLMQYIAPTGQFLIGVLLYKEEFTTSQAIGFSIIWFALIFFWTEGWLTSRKGVQEAQ